MCKVVDIKVHLFMYRHKIQHLVPELSLIYLIRYLVLFADDLPDEIITQETLDRAGATQAGANGKDAQAIKLKLQDRTQIWNPSSYFIYFWETRWRLIKN
jgi:hypothetical protein